MPDLRRLLSNEPPTKGWGYETTSDHFTDDARAVMSQVAALHENLVLHLVNRANARACAEAAGEVHDAWTAIETEWARNPDARRYEGFYLIADKDAEIRAAAARFLHALESEDALDEDVEERPEQ